LVNIQGHSGLIVKYAIQFQNEVFGSISSQAKCIFELLLQFYFTRSIGLVLKSKLYLATLYTLHLCDVYNKSITIAMTVPWKEEQSAETPMMRICSLTSDIWEKPWMVP
jgi:hypothetical protein